MAGTGAAVPSDAILDLKENAKTLDEFTSSSSEFVVGRTTPSYPSGKNIRTLTGINAVFDAAQAGQFVADSEAAADRAETAADVAMTAGWVYQTVAAGEAARTDGQYFWVVSTDNAEVLELWLMGATTATDTGKRTINKSVVEKISRVTSQAPWLRSDKRSDEKFNDGNSLYSVVAKAIKGFDFKEQNPFGLNLYISIFCVNHSLYDDNIRIRNADTASNYAEFSGTATKNPNGLTEVELTLTDGSGNKILMYVDYNMVMENHSDVINSDDALIYSDPVENPLYIDAENTLSSYVVQKELRDVTSLLSIKQDISAEDTWIRLDNLFDGKFLDQNSDQSKIKDAILGVYFPDGVSKDANLFVWFVSNNGPTHGDDRLLVRNGDTNLTYAGFYGAVGDKSGVVKLELTGDSRIWIYIDYSKLPANFEFNNSDVSSNPLYIDVINPTGYVIDEAVRELNSQTTSTYELKNIPVNQLSVVCAGSSITQGDGYLDSRYMPYVSEHLRTKLANTFHANEMILTGTSSVLNNTLFWRGSAVKLSGVGASAEATLSGDEVSVCFAAERGNVGAAKIDVYIDDSLYDTFDVVNKRPYSESVSESFTGDASAVKFPLPQAFTFDMTVTVDGSPQVVQYNTATTIDAVPSGVDVLIIRQIVNTGGADKVVHALWFANPPANGASIVASYSYGEHIIYAKTTIGNLSKTIDSQLESPRGDGDVAYDPANPQGVSSVLDFRHTDKEAVKTWKFATKAKRKVRFEIRGLHPNGTGTPVFAVNYVTNRNHWYMNAGIGGFRAADFSARPLRTWNEINDFGHDIILLESATNDDWVVNEFKAWRTLTGLTDSEVMDLGSEILMKSISGSSNNYTVDYAEIPIISATRTSVTLDGTNATFGVINAGDLITIGTWLSDNNRMVNRVVDTWDQGTNTVTFKEPIRVGDILGVESLSDLVGQSCIVSSKSQWKADVEEFINAVKASEPRTRVAIGTCGAPNLWLRRLEGYRELAERLATDLGVEFVDFYKQTLEWSNGQPTTAQVYLNNSQSTASTGASEYSLFRNDGSPLQVTWMYRRWSVKVDGVERYGKDCHVYGGRTYSWIGNEGEFTAANSSLVQRPYKLVFTKNPPANGKIIEVSFGPDKWAGDDCHPNETGSQLFASAINRVIK